jgi:hypothetical protein
MTKLAAALLEVLNVRGEPIPLDHAKRMTARQIVSLFEWDHWPIPKSKKGPDKPWNLTPRLRRAHRVKTAKVDIPAMAKEDRLAAQHREFVRKVLCKPCGQRRKRTGKWPSRTLRGRR